jgi:hypothetical protein
MSENEAEKEPESGCSSNMGGQTTTVMTVGGTFTTGVDASLNMSGIDDLGGNDEVSIYAASGDAPTERISDPGESRFDQSPAPNSFPTDLDGGTWVANTTYYVQVDSRTGNVWTTWQGVVTPTEAGGTLSIRLVQQNFE